MASKVDLLHFVGSIPLPDGDAVFEALSSSVGGYLRRMPDGETGERIKWIVFQQRMLTAHPAMEVDPDQPPLPVRQADSTVFREIRRLRMKADVDPDRVDFDTTYDSGRAGILQDVQPAQEGRADSRADPVSICLADADGERPDVCQSQRALTVSARL